MPDTDTEQDFKTNLLSIEEQQERSRHAAYEWERLSLIAVVSLIVVILIAFFAYKYQHTNFSLPLTSN